MIPKSEWKWSGVAGHFICGYLCRFHMRTEIGDILVSTVGEYYSGGPRDDSYVLESMGCTFPGQDRTFYETYVFRLGDERCARVDCDCGDREPAEWSEIAGRRWTLRGQAQRGHLEFCDRAARGEWAAEKVTP